MDLLTVVYIHVTLYIIDLLLHIYRLGHLKYANVHALSKPNKIYVTIA